VRAVPVPPDTCSISHAKPLVTNPNE
jgi:hypothetical protein